MGSRFHGARQRSKQFELRETPSTFCNARYDGVAPSKAPPMRLPSTRSLEAVASVARLGSLAAAGAEIGMSVPALSRRLALLEADLGVRLFERRPRGVALTVDGAAFLSEVSPALELLRRATANAGRTGRAVVRLTTIPALATRWLVPRLKDFEVAHPDIEVDVRTSIAFEDLETQRIDFAIRLATDGSLEGAPFLPIHLLPVWSHGHAKAFDSPLGVMEHTLLSPDHRPEFWVEWFRAYCPAGPIPRTREVDSLLLYELAMNGAGVAIGIEPLVSDLLRQNRLVGWRERRVRSERSFFLVAGKAPPSRAAKLFGEWLQELPFESL